MSHQEHGIRRGPRPDLVRTLKPSLVSNRYLPQALFSLLVLGCLK